MTVDENGQNNQNQTFQNGGLTVGVSIANTVDGGIAWLASKNMNPPNYHGCWIKKSGSNEQSVNITLSGIAENLENTEKKISFYKGHFTNETYSLCNTIPIAYSHFNGEATGWTYIGTGGTTAKHGVNLTVASHSSGTTAYLRDIDATDAWFGPICEGFNLVSPYVEVIPDPFNEINVTTIRMVKGYYLDTDFLSVVPVSHTRTGLQLGALSGHAYAGMKLIANDITVRVGDTFTLGRSSDTTSQFYHIFGSLFESYWPRYLDPTSNWSVTLQKNYTTYIWAYEDYLPITISETGDYLVTLTLTAGPLYSNAVETLIFNINVIGTDASYGLEVYGSAGPIYASYHSTWNQVAYRSISAFQNDSYSSNGMIGRELQVFFIMRDPPRSDALTLAPTFNVDNVIGKVMWSGHNVSGYVVILAR